MNIPANPVRYDPSVETVAPDEAETAAALQEALREILETTSNDYGHAARSVHAKGHALVDGTLTIFDDLPPALAQGLFARGGEHDVILRFSTNPGDILEDSVSVPRGVAIKISGVDSDSGSQDLIMVNGPAFAAPDAKKFLGNLKMLAKTTDKAEGAKKVMSAVLRTFEGALETVGLESAMAKNMGGQPSTHPLGDTYYGQVPFRYGDYIAKFSLAPVSPNLTALTDSKVSVIGRPDALREDLSEAFIESDSVWELRVQLCTDLETMPIEDATVVWDEDKSPFVAVGRISVPAQTSWQQGVSGPREDKLLFTPWHCLDAHRPLGSINRARKGAYEMSGEFRSRFNGCPIHEPSRTTADVG